MLTIVLGTRPEIIKCAPLVLEAQRRELPVEIIHTGQHYSRELDQRFFEELELPFPTTNLHVGSHPPAKQVALMMQGLSDVFERRRPTIVLVQGDTNSVLAGALVAHKMDIPVAHLEAGLRSDDWTMPEEANRVLTDRLSRWLFCPTDLQRERLKKEGIDHPGVSVTGNSIVDAVMRYADLARQKSEILDRLSLSEREYFLLTLHRPANVDDPVRLKELIKAAHVASGHLRLPIVFPIHPRTQTRLSEAGIVLPSTFKTLPPVGFLDLLRLEQSAAAVLTDSGGLQEEACILRVPCVTLRPNTERPETIEVGANILFDGTSVERLAQLLSLRLSSPRDWSNPFGDGQTAQRVLEILPR